MPRLILTMIVKNEGAIIGRCLDAALPHCAGYSITDTGSTDNTVAEIEAAGKRHNVPGRVTTEAWKNFGWNRTLSADRARGYILDQGWSTREHYLLQLDADMLLVVGPSFDPEKLTETAYSLIQKGGGLDYPNTRLCRGDLPWRSAGVTHEYWRCDPYPLTHSVLSPTDIYIDDRNDGGSKADKFQRDKVLLEEGLRAEPENVRYMFYLANTLRDLGEYRAAIEWYEKRARVHDNPDEPWYSVFQKGVCLMKLGDPTCADALLRAYNARPSRAEPLYYLAVHYREQGQNHAAMLLTDKVATIPYPEGAFFVERGIYAGTLVAAENAINGWHTGKRDLGERDTERIARQKGHSADTYEQMSRHASHYAEPLKAVAAGRFRVPDTIRQGFTSSSPTLVPHGDRYAVHVRLVNYDHAYGFSFVSRDPDQIIRTRGARCLWSPYSAPADWTEVDASFPEDWPRARVLGAEDQRWAAHAGRIYLTANTWQTPAKPDWPQMVLGRLDESLTRIEKWLPLVSPASAPNEKNWLPWVRDGELFLVYSYDPFRVVHPNLETGAAQTAVEWPSPWPGYRLRGSAGPVPHPYHPGHHLILVHEKAIFDSEHVYMQRLIETDELLRPIALSVGFYLDHRGVEFPLGFVDHDGKALITYGREERESAWTLVEWDELLSRFRF